MKALVLALLAVLVLSMVLQQKVPDVNHVPRFMGDENGDGGGWPVHG